MNIKETITSILKRLHVLLMDKETKNNLMGMIVYFIISLVFGGAFGLMALIIHEDNDRCHYYNGEWNKGDLFRGVTAIVAGSLIRRLLM